MEKDVLERLENLEKIVEKLQSDKNLNIFGRSYSQVGNSNSDFLIKTKGQVKIQWGNKFIDLIKDGKINSEIRFIYSVKDKSDIGIREGIYVLEDGSIYLKVSNLPAIPIAEEIGTTYVSFLGEQETTPDQKYQALQNIGFIYKDLDSVPALKSGIVYVESKQKLYIINNGDLTEFSLDLPNPFTKQFVVSKKDSKLGAILIKGEGKENSLAFDDLFVYSDTEGSFIDSNGILHIKVSQFDKLTIEENRASFSVPVVASRVESSFATEDNGFRLYIANGESTLEVDNLLVRNTIRNSEEQNLTIPLFPEYWLLNNNIIKEVVGGIEGFEDVDSEDSSDKVTLEDVEDNTKNSYDKVTFILQNYNTFNIGDIIIFYYYDNRPVVVDVKDFPVTDHDGNIIGWDTREIIEYVDMWVPLEATVIKKDLEKVAVQMTDVELAEKDMINLKGKFIFGLNSKEHNTSIRIQDNNIDLVKYSRENPEDSLKSEIESRYGDISDQYYKLVDTKEESPENKPKIYGLYSSKAIIKEGYIDNLPLEDNSAKIPNTLWVKQVVESSVPTGTILAFNGKTVPEGWQLCDGTNGTPNLVSNFILNSTASSEDLTKYSLVYIIRIV